MDQQSPYGSQGVYTNMPNPEEISKKIRRVKVCGIVLCSLIVLILISLIYSCYEIEELNELISKQKEESEKQMEANNDQWEKILEKNNQKWEEKLESNNEKWVKQIEGINKQLEENLKTNNEQQEAKLNNMKAQLEAQQEIRDQQQQNESKQLQDQYQQLKKEFVQNDFTFDTYFAPALSRASVEFRSNRRIKNINNENQNSLLNFQIIPDNFYELEFVAHFGQLTQIHLGITPNNQNWKEYTRNFCEQAQGYCIRLDSGKKCNEGVYLDYAKPKESGQVIKMRIKATKDGSISYQIGSIYYDAAYLNINFVDTEFYVAAYLYYENNEVEIIKASKYQL